MLNININSSATKVQAKVDLYLGSTLVKTCTCSDSLQEFSIDRVGEEGKFFGFGICQRLHVELIDLWRQLEVTTANTIEVGYIVEGIEVYPYPTFYVTEVNRDEKTNSISVTSYDLINEGTNHEVSELGELGEIQELSPRELATLCGTRLGVAGVRIIGVGDAETCFDITYSEGTNFSGKETYRDVLNRVAEVTQTIYYIDNENYLVFRRLAAGVDLKIEKAQYFELTSGANRRLTKLVHTTELGNNLETALEQTGTTQYIRDNPFWNKRDDVQTLLDEALAAVGGLTINQFSCDWFGNCLLEIGDRFELVTEDGGSVFSYVLNDSVTYDGTYNQITQWAYKEDEGQTAATPTSLGEIIKQTVARVDHSTQTITLLTQTTEANESRISSLELNTTSINLTVEENKKAVDEALGSVNDKIVDLSNKASLAVTAEDVTIAIDTKLQDGINEVTTTTGFTFNDEGLMVENTNSEMRTQITEDGMSVYRRDSEVLTANSAGVKAKDLHAMTYLHIGTYTRFEDYIDDTRISPSAQPRTGCFWVGGV